MRNLRGLAGGLALLWLAGCAGPGPRLFPVAPLAVESHSDGGSERLYDLNGNGRADFAEVLEPGGRVVALRYDLRNPESAEVDLRRIKPEECTHLILLLDSIPYEMVREARQQGRFRLFPPPSRIISPFPAMTDLSFTEFFNVGPALAVEAEYFDGEKLTGGLNAYTGAAVSAWQRDVDYVLSPVAHIVAYTYPHGWYGHELGRIQRAFFRRPGQRFIGYVVSTSGLGAKEGRDGHQFALVNLDRFCQAVMHHFRGRVQITLLSDHGHFFGPSRRIDLREILREFGYRVGKRLERPGDVVVPEFGPVSCAVVHTRAAAQVARDLSGVAGVGLTAYMENDAIVVLNRSGRARLRVADGRFQYQADYGDPLRLTPVFEQLAQEERIDEAGYVAGADLWRATQSQAYPDAAYRLWRAFHGLLVHTPDVFVSLEDGYHCGDKTMSDWLDLQGVHGNLGPDGSAGFAITTAGELPPVLRMEELRAALQSLGVPVP